MLLCWARGETLAAELARLEGIQYGQVPLPEFVEAMFDYSLSLIKAEAGWVKRTADYMENKPEVFEGEQNGKD